MLEVLLEVGGVQAVLLVTDVHDDLLDWLLLAWFLEKMAVQVGFRGCCLFGWLSWGTCGGCQKCVRLLPLFLFPGGRAW